MLVRSLCLVLALASAPVAYASPGLQGEYGSDQTEPLWREFIDSSCPRTGRNVAEMNLLNRGLYEKMTSEEIDREVVIYVAACRANLPVFFDTYVEPLLSALEEAPP